MRYKQKYKKRKNNKRRNTNQRVPASSGRVGFRL